MLIFFLGRRASRGPRGKRSAMKALSFWTVRLALLTAAFGLWFSFQKGDGPAANWSAFEQAGQSLAGAALFGSIGATFGLVFDLLGLVWRRSQIFVRAVRDQQKRL